MFDFKRRKYFIYFVLFFIVFVCSCAKDKNNQKYDKKYYEEIVFDTNNVFNPKIYQIEINPIDVETNE